jgi:hypothetical protein
MGMGGGGVGARWAISGTTGAATVG